MGNPISNTVTPFFCNVSSEKSPSNEGSSLKRKICSSSAPDASSSMRQASNSHKHPRVISSLSDSSIGTFSEVITPTSDEERFFPRSASSLLQESSLSSSAYKTHLQEDGFSFDRHQYLSDYQQATSSELFDKHFEDAATEDEGNTNWTTFPSTSSFYHSTEEMLSVDAASSAQCLSFQNDPIPISQVECNSNNLAPGKDQIPPRLPFMPGFSDRANVSNSSETFLQKSPLIEKSEMDNPHKDEDKIQGLFDFLTKSSVAARKNTVRGTIELKKTGWIEKTFLMYIHNIVNFLQKKTKESAYFYADVKQNIIQAVVAKCNQLSPEVLDQLILKYSHNSSSSDLAVLADKRKATIINLIKDHESGDVIHQAIQSLGDATLKEIRLSRNTFTKYVNYVMQNLGKNGSGICLPQFTKGARQLILSVLEELKEKKPLKESRSTSCDVAKQKRNEIKVKKMVNAIVIKRQKNVDISDLPWNQRTFDLYVSYAKKRLCNPDYPIPSTVNSIPIIEKVVAECRLFPKEELDL